MNALLKRSGIAIAILLIISIISIYLFIPSEISIRNRVFLNCNTAAASRTINNSWKNIFNHSSDTSFVVNDCIYTIYQPLYNGSKIRISSNGKNYETMLSLIPVSTDTSILQWNETLQETYNPIKRLTTYIEAKKLQTSLEKTILKMQNFLEKTTNIYGYNIMYATLTDSIVVSSKTVSSSYPSTKIIYELINELKTYIAVHHVKETNSPMLNVSYINKQYITMVGIPINKEIEQDNKIEIKRLIPIKNKILTTEVKGGVATIKDAYKKIELFMQDRSLSAPVIPYEFIITDRSKQPDTTRWISKIIYPIA